MLKILKNFFFIENNEPGHDYIFLFVFTMILLYLHFLKNINLFFFVSLTFSFIFFFKTNSYLLRMFLIKGLKLYWIESNLGTFKPTNCLRINTLKACPGTDVLAKINKCNRGKHCGKTNDTRGAIFIS